MRWDTSPAPFEVPPDSTSMSLSRQAPARIAASSCCSSSAMAPRKSPRRRSRHRRSDDRAVGVVDRRRTQRTAGLHQFVAGREHRDARPARHRRPARCRRPPACRSRANRSRCRRAAAPRRARCRNRHRTRIAPARRRGGSRSRASPAGSVCSTMTMASAPRGTGPPVAIDVAVPDSTGRVGAVPQAITSSFSTRRTGAASLAEARSAERTAKPSTLERSNGGTSIGATTSAASAQPSASASGRGSLGTARGNNAASNRASASSRDRMVRNWS